MTDTIERIVADIIVAAGRDGEGLAGRTETIVCKLEAEITALRQELKKVKTLSQAKDAKIRELKGQIAKLNKMKFGASADHNPDKKSPATADKQDSSAEEVSPENDQPANSTSPEELSPEKPTKSRKSAGRAIRVWPKHLERREIYMGTIDEKCPCGCGGSIRGYDHKETLEVVPARHYIAVRKYPRFRCRAKDKTVGTPFNTQIFPHSTMSHSILANSIFMRFGAQLPWYRQESIFRSYGIDMSRSTLMKGANRLATEALSHIYNLIKLELCQNSARLFMDETTIPMLTPGKGKTSTSYLFALHRDDSSFGGNKPPAVLFYPSKTRARYKIHEILNGVEAIVQTDAYVGYAKLGQSGTPVEGIISPKCWAHSRRKFTDEFEFNKTEDAKTVIAMIAELYAEERKVKGKPPIVREAHRRKYSAPILARLKAFLEECSGRHLKQSRMTKAINYAQNHWSDLVLFVEDGHIDLDTNSVERMFKPVILLRKNALFMGSDEGAEAWGILASIVETCKLNGVNVEPYLKWVMDEIADKLPLSKYEKLLPWNAPAEFRVKR